MTQFERLQAYRLTLKERGITLYRLSQILRIGYDRVYHYFNARFSKISKRDRKLIRRWLIEERIMIVKARKPPLCRGCGIEYPTRKSHPQLTQSSDAAQSKTVAPNSQEILNENP
jgi:hypothetical protein